MHIFYVDESYDETGFALTALGVKDVYWHQVFTEIKTFRANLARSEGIYMRRELHASSFIRDCSDGISRKKLSLADRRSVYERVLHHIASLKLRLFNIYQPVEKWGSPNATHLICVERMANRIDRTMKARDSYAVVVIDEGKEREITRLIRKTRIYNPIPSRWGRWPEGEKRNIRVERMIDDPFFKESSTSYFLQLCDFAAFALLKKEVPPSNFIAKWGYDRLFPALRPVLFHGASPRDPDGIVR